MKRLLGFLLVMSSAAFSIENLEKMPDDENSEEEIENNGFLSPLRTLPNFETYSIIECLKPREVLLSTTIDSCLNASDLFNDFNVISYQSARHRDAFYFVPEKMAKSAEKALTLYSKTKPGFYAYLIPVKEDGKFLELARKTSAGCAKKSGKWTRDTDWKTLTEVFSGGYNVLDRAKVAHAASAPSQRVDQRNGEWCCGPNSGYRFLRCLGQSDHDYDGFVDGCPRSISKNDIQTTGSAVALGAGLLGWLLAPVTAGVSIIPALGLTAVGMGTNAVGTSLPSDVGPRPRELASYLTSKMKGGGARFVGYNTSLEAEEALHTSIKWGKPIIVLLVSGTTSMHYVVVIGVKPAGKYIRQAVILDTDGAIGVISDERLSHWMDSKGYANCWPILEARFNTIQFCCSCCMSR